MQAPAIAAISTTLPRLFWISGVDQQAHRDDRRHAAREAVEAVDQVDRVGHADHPEERDQPAPDSQMDLADERQVELREAPADPHQEPRGEELDDELLARRDPEEIVHQADQEDQPGGDRQRHQLRPRDRHPPLVPAGHETDERTRGEAGGDRHPAEARHRGRQHGLALAAPPSSGRAVERAQELREVHHRRHEQVRDDPREQRGGTGDNDQRIHVRVEGCYRSASASRASVSDTSASRARATPAASPTATRR